MARSVFDRRFEHSLRNTVIAACLAFAWIGLLLGASTLLKRLGGDAPNRPLTVALRGAAQPVRANQGSDDDRRRSEKIVGTWRDHYQGERTMTVRDNGTATMVVVLRGMKARLFTPRLQLEMVWSVRNGHMTRRTTGGTPADKVEFVNRYAGKQVSEEIVKLTDRQLILLDQDGATRYIWQRMAAR